jgi:hypothetical protein
MWWKHSIDSMPCPKACHLSLGLSLNVSESRRIFSTSCCRWRIKHSANGFHSPFVCETKLVRLSCQGRIGETMTMGSRWKTRRRRVWRAAWSMWRSWRGFRLPAVCGPAHHLCARPRCPALFLSPKPPLNSKISLFRQRSSRTGMGCVSKGSPDGIPLRTCLKFSDSRSLDALI